VTVVGREHPIMSDGPNGLEHDVLKVKRNSEREFHFHYRREERLQRRAAQDPKLAVRLRRNRKVGKWLIIALALSILVLASLLIYRFFFQ
jgi:hypothetical protein